MFLSPPLKSSAAIRAASTEPMPLVSWKMPEISLSTPIRTTLSEISASAAPHAAHDNPSPRPKLRPLIVALPVDPFSRLLVSAWVSYPCDRSIACRLDLRADLRKNEAIESAASRPTPAIRPKNFNQASDNTLIILKANSREPVYTMAHPLLEKSGISASLECSQ